MVNINKLRNEKWHPSNNINSGLIKYLKLQKIKNFDIGFILRDPNWYGGINYFIVYICNLFTKKKRY